MAAEAALERVGFIGLGNIGAPMAQTLCTGPFEVVAYDLVEEAVAALAEAGASPAASSREVGTRCQVVGVCVVDDAATEAVVGGDEGVLAGAAPGTVIVLHSTTRRIFRPSGPRFDSPGRSPGIRATTTKSSPKRGALPPFPLLPQSPCRVANPTYTARPTGYHRVARWGSR